MRNLLLAAAAIILVVLTYIGSIAVSVHGLVEAARAGNVGEIAARTDFARLRGSVTGQILDAYLEKNGRDQKPLNRMLINTYGASVVDALIAKFLTPQNLTTLLQSGAVTDTSRGTTWQAPSITTIDGSRVVDLIGRLRPIQIKEIEIRTSTTDTPETYAAISLHLDGTTWKLSGARLPKPLVEKLAASLPKR
jgi:hypothetical protein